MRLRSVRRRDVWLYVGCIRCATQDDGEFHINSGEVDGNCAGMMLRMSCAHRDASRDRIGVAGIIMNDGHGCGSRKHLLVANG